MMPPASRIMQTGWFKEVCVKNFDSHAIQALLASRALAVRMKSGLANQARDIVKKLWLETGGAKFNVDDARDEEPIEGQPALAAAVEPLLTARGAIEQQISDLARKVMKLARHDEQVRRFMTTPG